MWKNRPGLFLPHRRTHRGRSAHAFPIRIADSKSRSPPLNQNGPWLLDQFGEAHENPYSWTNLSNIVFIEQPVGTGFTTGTPTADDETDNATQFIGFLDHFYSLFPELQGKNLWITGESYAGKVRAGLAFYLT